MDRVCSIKNEIVHPIITSSPYLAPELSTSDSCKKISCRPRYHHRFGMRWPKEARIPCAPHAEQNDRKFAGLFLRHLEGTNSIKSSLIVIEPREACSAVLAPADLSYMAIEGPAARRGRIRWRARETLRQGMGGEKKKKRKRRDTRKCGTLGPPFSDAVLVSIRIKPASRNPA